MKSGAAHLNDSFIERVEERTSDSWESQCAALAYTDTELGRLFHAMPGAGLWLVILCADHGDAFGEDGHHGHGIAHPCVWSVPYAEALMRAK
ncbi:hypothetical protein [Streptomyces katsurahamanus]|uniref:Sulfatase N-terminal domain-containing protein n=1 Tax=Streptomyces katsurahamanus TaxID=2577098 RepID=A0ABW9NYG0_9ACTN|nr:hypothetical protein [Streptomyces katsurahamanus]MQS38372.1 hypothetical protein [Streptomyces katsurahamanus]